MNDHLKKYIHECSRLDFIKYHELLNLFGKEIVMEEIDNYVKEELNKDFSCDNQTKLWNRFGYYFATLDYSVFVEKAILNISPKLFNKHSRGGLSLEDEKKYGYHLLCRDYITICCDDSKNKVDMMKVFASIRHVEVRDLVLKRFDYLYQNISRISNYDDEMKEFLKNYQQLCLNCEIPYLSYDGEVLEEDVLLEQLDMYIRYSIAKDNFIQNNLRLIYNLCSNRLELNCDYDDLFLEGYLGLLKGIEGYDVRKGWVFSTYAVKVIKNAIWSYQDNCVRMIRLPVHLEELIYKINKFSSTYYFKFGKYPSDDELALKLGYSVEKIREVKQMLFQGNCFSLEQNVLEDEDSSVFGDFVSDESVCVEDDVINSNYMEYLLKLIDEKLKEREKYILLRYTLDDETLENIGLEVGLSRERVRQIKNKALKKMRMVPNISKSI